MAIVVDGKIVVNGMVVGSVEESQYPVTSVVVVEYDRQPIYVIDKEV